jgi:hypothetical protein
MARADETAATLFGATPGGRGPVRMAVALFDAPAGGSAGSSPSGVDAAAASAAAAAGGSGSGGGGNAGGGFGRLSFTPARYGNA